MLRDCKHRMFSFSFSILAVIRKEGFSSVDLYRYWFEMVNINIGIML